MNDLEDIATRFQIYLERLKTSDYRTYNRVLQELIATVEKHIGQTSFNELPRARIEKIIERIIEEHDPNMRAALAVLTSQLKDLAVYSFQFEASSLMVATTATNIIEEVGRTAIWTSVVDRPMSMDGSLLPSYLKELSTNQVVATTNLVRRAHAEGWNTNKIMQAFRGTRRNQYKDGIVPRVGRTNELTIRTAVQHVASAARAEVWEQNKDIVKQYQFVATLDSRTTAQCRSLDGQKFEVGKGPLPPLHRGCRSTTVAVVDSKYDFLDEGATRASATGPVPQEQTYYDWLLRQSAEFQDSVIGPTRGRLLRKGGLTATEFARLQLNRFFEPMTLDEMRALQPLAFKRAGI